jgi:hypothetical protein
MSARPRLAAAALGLLLLGLLGAVPAAAAEPTFGAPSAEATFGEGIVFRQPVTSPVDLARVEILLEYPEGLGPFVVESAGPTPAGSRDLVHRYALGEDGHLVPNTTIVARWRLVPADRSIPPSVGPPVEVVYADSRFDWRTRAGDLVRLHWYEGSDAFGRRALEIAETAVRDAAAFMGVTESDPIDFFVYADQAAFYDALGPATRENVGGQAHSDIRTMFALIDPGELNDRWVGIVIPHELTHLVFDTAVRNPYHFPPRWLNEGVATYLSEGYTASDRAAVESAAADGRLMPLRALGGQFPTAAERFYLAYAESVSAVAFLVREQGEDALVRLIRTYADGVSDDVAFRAAVGTDLAGFESAWLDDLGAVVPTEHGPQPAPAGPLPADWTADATPAPTTPAGAASPAPTAAPESPAGDDRSGSPLGEPLVLAGIAVAGLAVGGAIGYARRRRTTPGPPP